MATKEEDTLQSTVDDLELTFEPLDSDDESDVTDFDEIDDPAVEEDLDEEEIEETDDTDDSDDEESDEVNDEVNDDEGDEPDPDTGEEPDEDEEPASIVETVITSLGYEFSDEELEGLEDSEEGLTKLVDVASKKASEDRFNQMIESSPNVKALYDFEQAGGDPQAFAEAFYPDTDYNKVDVPEEDVDTQKSIIRESLKNKGLSNERINRNLQAIEDSGNLLDEAKDSLSDLREMQEQRKQQIQESTKQAQQEAREQAERMWNKVEDTVRTGNLSNIPLPKKQQNEFLEFIQVNPETGMSKRDEAIASMSIDEQLALDAIVFHGLDALNELVDKKANSKSNKTLRERLKSQKKRAKSSSQDPDLEDKSTDVEELQFRIDA